jgi:hypothetical protein
MIPGIMESWGNGGGVFDLGWSRFQTSFMDWYRHAREQDEPTDCVVFIMWHRSESCGHLGCKAHGYDDAVAENAALVQADNLWRLFTEDGGGHHLYPIVCCLETDTESLTLQQMRGSTVLDLSQMGGASEWELRGRLYAFYPKIPHHVLDDLLPIILGNIRHAKKIRSMNRTLEECDHCENIIGVGRGLHWLGRESFVIGPFDEQFQAIVVIAGKIVLKNLESGAVDSSRGAILLSSAPCRGSLGKPGRAVAELKARNLARAAEEVLREKVPGLIPHLRTVAGVVDNDTRLFIPASAL